MTGALALVGALCALLLIRSKDFVEPHRAAGRAGRGDAGERPPATCSQARSA